MDINYRLSLEKGIKGITSILLVCILCFGGTAMAMQEYQVYVQATEVPAAPTITATADHEEKVVNLAIQCKEHRKKHENIVLMATEKEGQYKELLTTKEDQIVIENLNPNQEYFFKVKVRAFYKSEPIMGYISSVAAAQIKVEEVKKASVTETEEMKLAPAVHNSTSAWVTEVRAQLTGHGVYTEAREAMILNIIHHESTGREHAVGAGGEYVGLVQFGGHWKHDFPESYFQEHGISGPYQADNRYSGSWSIHRLVQVIVESGDAGIKRHWPNTWNK